MRTMPKVVVALVGGWAAGGGHSLHVVSDLTIASREHARFKQTDADVGSFDAGYGSATSRGWSGRSSPARSSSSGAPIRPTAAA